MSLLKKFFSVGRRGDTRPPVRGGLPVCGGRQAMVLAKAERAGGGPGHVPDVNDREEDF